MTLKPFKPLLVTVVWSDPRSLHDSYLLEEVVAGKGVGPYRNRKTVGYLCYMNEEYLELYSDLDEEETPVEVGAGTAIFHVLITKVRIGQRGPVLYTSVTT